MKTLSSVYSDLKFSPSHIYFTDDELNKIAVEFWGNGIQGTWTHRERAFVQAALFIAVDKSEKAGMLFDLWKKFSAPAPTTTLLSLVAKLVQVGAKYAYSKYIDDDPKYSAVGRAAVQYSAFSTEWKLRVGVGDESYLSDFRQN